MKLYKEVKANKATHIARPVTMETIEDPAVPIAPIILTKESIFKSIIKLTMRKLKDD